MNGIDYGRLSVIINILLLLFIFSYFFNKKIESLGHNTEGWTWLTVVIGVGVTQVGVGLLDLVLNWNAFYIGILAYTASGSPMIYGALLRYIEKRERARKAMSDDA
jgi:heme A synthase